MMDWVTENIAIGNYEDAQGDQPRRAGITAVLNVCLEREDFPKHREYERNGVVYAKVPLWDKAANSERMIHAAAVILDELLKAGHKVLVHCGAGVSRSPSVVYYYMERLAGFDPVDAYLRIHKARPQVNRNFWKWERLLKEGENG